MAQKFRKAKFRDIEFFVSESEAEFGRRIVKHEYPNKNVPGSEDLGRKARSFTVEAYLVGENIDAEKVSLIEAIEADGPGILIHPYYGKRTVNCTSGRVRERSTEKYFVSFTLSFEEAGEFEYPRAADDTTFQLTAAANAVGAAGVADFASKFTLKGKPQFMVDSAVAKINGLSDKLESLTGNASSLYRASAELSFAIRNLRASTADLINTPESIGNQVRESMNLLASSLGLGSGPKSKLTTLAGLLSYGSDEDPVVGDTANRVQEEANRNAMNDLVRMSALEQASIASLTTAFTSIEDASAARDQLLEKVDEMELTASDDTLLALTNLRAKLCAAVPKQDQSLANLVTIETSGLRTSLDLSYELYGNLDLEQDIIDRNSIRNPGQIAGGRSLEVLSNG